MSNSNILADTITSRGRQMSGVRIVTAAELAAATPAGLLTLAPESGAAIVIESGAVLGGISLSGYPDPDTAIRPDITIEDPASVAWVSLGASSASPAGILNEDATQTPEHRLRVINSFLPGVYGDGWLTQNRILLIYDHALQRWIVSWAAPSPFVPSITSAATASDAGGAGITYTATVAGSATTEFAVLSDGGSGISVDTQTGVMSGGGAAVPGDYTITIVAGNMLAASQAVFVLVWTVT